MASRVSLTLFVLGHGCHGLSSRQSDAYLLFRSPILPPISCKMRSRNFSSHNRRQQVKKAPRRNPSLDSNYPPREDEGADTEMAITETVSESYQDTQSDEGADSNAVIKNSNGADFGNSDLSVETKSRNESGIGGDQISNIRLEDLIGMIKNAEKNVLLLNEARVHAIEDLDKILSEKEALQGQINTLEMRLAEADARIKVAAQEKIHVELLEDKLEKLKIEMSDRDQGSEDNLYEDRKRNLIVKSPLSDASGFTSLSNELDLVRKENMELKDDIQTLERMLSNVKETGERVLLLEKERSSLEATLKELESRVTVAQEDVSKLSTLKYECKVLQENVENLQGLLDKATKQADQAILVVQQNHDLQKKVDRLEESLEKVNSNEYPLESSHQFTEHLQQKVILLEERFQKSDEEIHSHVQMYHESVRQFQDTVNRLKEESKRRAQDEPVEDMPWEFWSRLLITFDGWLLEKKISSEDAKLLRDLTWKRDARIRDTYFTCKDKGEHETLATFLKLVSSRTWAGLHVIHIAAEMAPVAKVGGLGDVVSGLSKALQKKGHLVEIVLPKYDCMQYDRIGDLKVLDVVVQSYFDGQLFSNKVWVGTVEGLPVYFIEPLHPAKLFWRGQFYGEHDDFKRFSFFSRAALQLLLQAGKKPDIIHCHDWQTAFVAPLYWDIFAPKGLNSARICFTCHNFEYQGTSPASELSSCGLDVHQLNRPDRMQDNVARDRINPVKGAVVFSNIVTTVSPTYAQEVRTAEGGRGLHVTLNSHSKKFVGILNGIDTDSWNPSADTFLRYQYTADDLRGKAENKDAIRKQLKLSSADATRPLVGCITRLVPQKGVHLIRHAIYRTMELGGQFVLLGSSPVPHIQREFEGIANHFENSPHVRLILKYDESLSHSIFAASDMFIIPSIFEPCGLTQMIAMRYGSVPIVRKTGGLNDSVFDIDDDTIPIQFQNGFTFLNPDEQGVNNALERAFNHYTKNTESWQQLVQRNMKIDFSWDSSAAQYEELYEKSVARARAAASRSA
ncbi:hypothetical protein AAC387_Pa12g2265 [Persea americana]